jgi:hypothetical protein
VENSTKSHDHRPFPTRPERRGEDRLLIAGRMQDYAPLTGA